MKPNSIENYVYDFEAFRKSLKPPKIVPVICHYTNIPILLKILDTKKIKFNRIDFVNDLTEKEGLKENNNYKMVFVSCFTKNDEEKIPMWKIYTKGATGVFVKFFFKENIPAKELFNDSLGCHSKNTTIPIVGRNVVIDDLGASLDFYNVEYVDKFIKSATKKHSDGNTYDYPFYFARYKRTCWEYEEELRYNITLKTGQNYNKNRQDFKELFLTINFNCLDKIEIVFNPWTSKNEWESILNPFITKINKDLFELKDSILKNTIKF